MAYHTCTVCIIKVYVLFQFYVPQNANFFNKRKISVSLLLNKLHTKIVQWDTWTCRLASSASLQTHLDMQLLQKAFYM